MRIVQYLGILCFIFAGVLFSNTVSAQEVYTIIIKNHRFDPAEIHIPAAVKVKIIVENQDAEVEEFESFDLNREKLIAAKSKGIIFIGPLKPGEYKFFGDFHQDTAQGIVRVMEPIKLKKE